MCLGGGCVYEGVNKLPRYRDRQCNNKRRQDQSCPPAAQLSSLPPTLQKNILKGHCVNFQQLSKIEDISKSPKENKQVKTTFLQSCANLTQHCFYFVIFFFTMQTINDSKEEMEVSRTRTTKMCGWVE